MIVIYSERNKRIRYDGDDDGKYEIIYQVSVLSARSWPKRGLPHIGYNHEPRIVWLVYSDCIMHKVSLAKRILV